MISLLRPDGGPFEFPDTLACGDGTSRQNYTRKLFCVSSDVVFSGSLTAESPIALRVWGWANTLPTHPVIGTWDLLYDITFPNENWGVHPDGLVYAVASNEFAPDALLRVFPTPTPNYYRTYYANGVLSFAVKNAVSGAALAKSHMLVDAPPEFGGTLSFFFRALRNGSDVFIPLDTDLRAYGEDAAIPAAELLGLSAGTYIPNSSLVNELPLELPAGGESALVELVGANTPALANVHRKNYVRVLDAGMTPVLEKSIIVHSDQYVPTHGEPLAELVPSQLPAPVGWSAATVVDNFIYHVGGAPHTSYGKLTCRFDILNGYARENLANLPAKLHRHSMFTHDGKPYVAGGLNISNVAVSTIYVYNDVTDVWEVAPFSLPTVRAGGHTIIVNGELWVFGGTTSTALNSSYNYQFERYNFATDTWTSYTVNYPFTVRGALAQFGEIVYVLGGYYNSREIAKVDFSEVYASGGSPTAELSATLAVNLAYPVAFRVGNGDLFYVTGYYNTGVVRAFPQEGIYDFAGNMPPLPASLSAGAVVDTVGVVDQFHRGVSLGGVAGGVYIDQIFEVSEQLLISNFNDVPQATFMWNNRVVDPALTPTRSYNFGRHTIVALPMIEHEGYWYVDINYLKYLSFPRGLYQHSVHVGQTLVPRKFAIISCEALNVYDLGDGLGAYGFHYIDTQVRLTTSDNTVVLELSEDGSAYYQALEVSADATEVWVRPRARSANTGEVNVYLRAEVIK